MYKKKSREVNIFSASVVDLFASGLGVFLIVAIIALVNQKKEETQAPLDSKSVKEELRQVQEELVKITKKQKETQAENIRLRAKKAELDDALKMAEKSQFFQKGMLKKQVQREGNERISSLEKELEETKKKIEIQKQKIKELEVRQEQVTTSQSSQGVKKEARNYNKYEIGSKFKLNNGQFYAGTDRPIEPYASHEISSFAEFLRNNPTVMVEISGHIFETKDAIESGQAADVYNLSVKRAKAVCKSLQHYGVNSKRLNCVGYGASRPIVLTNNPYSEEAQKNRRVEVEILSK